MGLFSLSFLDYNCDKYCRKRDPSVATAGLNRKLEAEKFWFSLHKQGSVLSFSSPFSFLFYSELKRGGLHHGVWDAGRVMILFFLFFWTLQKTQTRTSKRDQIRRVSISLLPHAEGFNTGFPFLSFSFLLCSRSYFSLRFFRPLRSNLACLSALDPTSLSSQVASLAACSLVRDYCKVICGGYVS